MRAAAARRRITQRTIAQALGMSQQALSRRWTAELPFDADQLIVIASLLGMDPRDFFPPAGSGGGRKPTVAKVGSPLGDLVRFTLPKPSRRRLNNRAA